MISLKCLLFTPILTFLACYAIIGTTRKFAVALSPSDTGTSSRRDLLAGGTAAAVAAAFSRVAPAAAVANDETTQQRPIAILGASGRTGALCVSACLSRGVPVRALTRSGDWQVPATDVFGDESVDYSRLLSIRKCDVRDAASVAEAVEGCRGVVYAASASKKGGSAKEIDNEGVVTAANACIAAGVPRYVVISSTATTRPKSLGYIFTNVFSSGGIMDEKHKGEVGVQLAYKDVPSSNTGLSYTVIRPGGLEEPKLNKVFGPGSLEFSQGDVLAGIISRADLADTTIATTLSNAPNLKDTSFEVYYTDSVQPSEGRFKTLVDDGKVSRVHGDAFETLFSGIKPDGKYYVPE